MDYYDINSVTAGNDTLIDVYNKLLINVERLKDFSTFYASSYRTVRFNPPTPPGTTNARGLVPFKFSESDPTFYFGRSKVFETIELMDKKNFDRFIVPDGYSYARLHATAPWGNSYTGDPDTFNYYFNTLFLKNGSDNIQGFADYTRANSNSAAGSYGADSISSAWINVVGGDYFQLAMNVLYGNNVIGPQEANFGIELKK